MLLVILMWVRGLGHQDLGLGSQILVNITGAWAPPHCSIAASVTVQVLRRSVSVLTPPSRLAFQGHRNRHVSIRYTDDFLLTFNSNHGPISHRFRDKR